MQAQFFEVTIVVDERGADTRAVARLQMGATTRRVGTGIARHTPGVGNGDGSAVELATARALSDLAEQLFASADTSSALPNSWL